MNTITHASAKDAETILELQRLAYQSEAQRYDSINIPPLKQTIDELRSEFAYKTFLKIQVESWLVGSVRGCLKGDTCHIGRLIVHPNYQRQGLGTALLGEIESCFEKAQRFELFTGHKSEGNIRLYERLGYVIFKREEINHNLTLVFLEKYN